MRWVRRALYTLVGLSAAAALVFTFLPKPVAVEVAAVTRGLFVQTVDEDGTTRARERYTVSAPLAGRLHRIGLKAGDPVRRGQTVAVIAPSAPSLLDERAEQELRQRLGSAQASKERASAAAERAAVSRDHARVELDRARRLAGNGLATRQELDRAEVALRLAGREVEVARFEEHAAEHDVETARASLARLRDQPPSEEPRLWEVRSPAGGRVLRVLQESEGPVAPGTPLLEVADLSELEVVVDLLTSDAAEVKPGMVARLECREGCDPLEGRVRRVEPSAFMRLSALGVEEQRVNVRIDILSPRERWENLGDGYRVDAHVEVYRKEDAVKAPASALFRHGSGWAVFVVSGGKAHRRPVVTPSRNAQEALVEQGLQPGETVIVFPGDAVRDGARVRLR